MNFFRITYFFIFLFIHFFLVAQDFKSIETLKTELAQSTADDSMKVKKLVSLSNLLGNYQFKNAVDYANQALSISKKINYTKGIVIAYNSLADANWFHSDYDKAQQYYFKAYRLSDSLHYQHGIAFSLYNIGWILCIQQHNYKENHYLYKSLSIYTELKDTVGMTKVFNALASYYSDRFKADKNKNNFDSSITYFNKGINFAKRSLAYADLGRFYGNMGELFYLNKDYKSAIFYDLKSYEIHKKSQDSSSMMICTLNTSLCYLETNEINKAISNFEYLYQYNNRHEIKDIQLGTLEGLSEGNFKIKNFEKAYNYQKEYIALKAEIDKQAYSTSISNLQVNYSLEKSQASIEQLKQANEIQELRNKKNIYFIFVLLTVALIVIVAVVLLIRQNKLKQNINIKLKQQNHIIAEKKQEIDNSIQYAKGIQQAILPAVAELDNRFAENFVLYKPKDVVSGDFYWFGKVDDYFYCIAADCTGHGVPGALMSIIGIDKIVQALHEQHITEPGKVLAFLNKQIKQVLKQHSDESKQKDGMDIAVLRFNNTLTQVQFAGANRPLYIVRNKELFEYKANKTAIAGFTPDEHEFTTTQIALQKNDALYIFTDGYADQFGGPEGKKFMSKNLKQLLIDSSHLTAKQQFNQMEQSFNNWKGTYEQVDDVLVIGIKI